MQRKAPLAPVVLAFSMGILAQYFSGVEWTLETAQDGKLAVLAGVAAAGLWMMISWRALVPPWPVMPLVAVTGFFLACCGSGGADAWSPIHLKRVMAQMPQHVVLRGEIWSDPVERDAEGGAGAASCDFAMRVSAVRQTTDWQPANGTVQVYLRLEKPLEMEFGQEVEIEGVLGQPEQNRNFYLFDHARYLRGNGIGLVLRARGADAVRFCGVGEGWGWVFRLRRALAERLTLGVERDALAVGFIRGMLLGYREDIPPDVKEAFRRTGTLHVIAISGSHISMIAAALLLILRLLRTPIRRVLWVVVPLLVLYVAATGLRASAIRSLIMAGMVIAGWSLGRPAALLNSLAAAALIILAWEPGQLFDPGFQLSFVVVGCLILFVPWVQERLMRQVEPDPYIPRSYVPRWRLCLLTPCRWGASLVAVSVVAGAGTFGLTLYYFNLISFSAVWANLLIVPLSSASVALGVASLMLGGFWTQLAWTLNAAHAVLIHLMIGLAEWLAAIPGSVFYVPQPHWSWIAAGYGVLGGACWFWRSGWRWRAAGLAGFFCGVVLMMAGWACFSREVRLDVMDVGGGQAVLVTGPRFERILIDAGSAGQGRTLVEPFLRARGVNVLDWAVVTHADAAHYGGLDALAGKIPIRHVLAPAAANRSSGYRQCLFRLREAGARVVKEAGMGENGVAGWRLGKLRIWWPPAMAAAGAGKKADDSGLVVELAADVGRCVFAGDIGRQVEQRLLERIPAVDDGEGRPPLVLVQGLHMTGESFDKKYLECLAPSLIVANTGVYPPQAFPSEEVRDRLARSGVMTCRTDETGGVMVRMTPGGIQRRCFLKTGCGW